MERKVYVVPRTDDKIEFNGYLEAARQLGIGEVANGIPPRYAGIIQESELPFVLVEQYSDDAAAPSLNVQLKDISARIDKAAQEKAAMQDKLDAQEADIAALKLKVGI